MPPSATTRSPSRRILTAGYAATINFIIPVLLAWLLTGPLYRYCYPSVKDREPNGGGFGPVSMQVRLSGTNAGIPEPLVVCGIPGRASLLYIRVLRKDRALMGIEFWGKKAVEGDSFAVPADLQIAITCSLPALYPPEGDRHWRGIPASLQKQHHAEYVVSVDGVVRLRGPIDYEEPSHSPLFFGVNSVGGSWVSSRFTGMVLKVSQSL